MRKVKIKLWIPIQRESTGKIVTGTGKFTDDFTTEGLFHQWGSESYEDTSISVALVELPDGTIEPVLPCNVKFTN